MDNRRIDALSKELTTNNSRRGILQVLSASGFAAILERIGVADEAQAKKKRAKSNKAKPRCRKNGSACKKPGKQCKARFCLKTPFTIEARWSNDASDHDTFLFVPNVEGNDDPFPVVRVTSAACRASGNGSTGFDGSVYPFAFIDRDAQGPGNEITTVRQLLDGTYEYWIELARPAAPGEVEVVLRNANGTVMRSFSSPENANPLHEIGWHVFDLDGATRRVSAVDEVTGDVLPTSAHAESTDVCPA